MALRIPWASLVPPLAVVIGAAWAVGVVLAQEPAPGPAKPAEESGGIRELEPSVLVVIGKNGEKVLAPGWTLDRLTKLIEAEKQEQLPSYSLRSLLATGKVRGEFAELTLKFDILAPNEGLVRVPLRLPQAVLTDPKGPKPGPPGSPLIDFQSDEYVAWIRSAPNKQNHLVTLDVWVPVRKVGSQYRLQLTTPRAVASELKLEVPVEFDRPPEASVGIADHTVLPSGKREIQVSGFSGDLQLTWFEPSQETVRPPTAVNVTGAVLVRIDGRSVTSSVSLALQSLSGGQFQSFRVRLPAGALRIPGDAVGYRFEDDPSADGARRVVKVLLDKPTAAQTVRLLTEHATELAQATSALETAGYEVFDIQDVGGTPVAPKRQSGHIALFVGRNWQTTEVDRRFVHPVALGELPAELPRDGVRDAYEYVTQPCLLRVGVRPRETRTSVDPEYQVFVRADRVELEATWRFMIRGAPALGIDLLNLADWRLDEAGPLDLVDQQNLLPNEMAKLSLRLTQATTGKLDVTIKAHRDLPPGTANLDFGFPVPLATTIGPARVAIQLADNLELTPAAGGFPGLARYEPAAGTAGGGPRTLHYRGDVSKARFLAELKVQRQQVSVAAHSQADIGIRGGAVEQTFDYDVRYEPLTALTLDVPTVLARPDGLAIYLGADRLRTTFLRDDERAADSTVRLGVALNGPRSGAFQIKVRYELPRDPLPADASDTLRIPLTMPDEGLLLRNQLRIVPALGVTVRPRAPSPWTPVAAGPQDDRAHAFVLECRDRAAECELAAVLEDQHWIGGVRVERAWLQTALSAAGRRERAVFRLTSDERQLDVILPGEASRDLSIEVDGRPAAAAWVEADVVRVTLPPSDAARTLEVRWLAPAPLVAARRFLLTPPQIRGAATVQEAQWQLILPRDAHLLSGPSDFVAEQTWDWRGFTWGRFPLRSQADLEDWSGAAPRPDAALGGNVYLFSQRGELGPLAVRCERRPWLVLLASLGLLSLALAWTYRPGLRRPGALFLLILAGGAAAYAYPEPTLVLAHAGGVGLVLAIVAWLLHRLVSRRQPRDLSSILRPEGMSTEFRPVSLPSSAPASTPPITVSGPISAQESSR